MRGHPSRAGRGAQQSQDARDGRDARSGDPGARPRAGDRGRRARGVARPVRRLVGVPGTLAAETLVREAEKAARMEPTVREGYKAAHRLRDLVT
jgi:hypothetical protein